MSEALPTPSDCCCCCRETIIINQSGGGGGQVFHGDGPPTGPQTDQDVTKAAIYYDDLSPGIWYPWDVALQAWATTIPEAP